jgi:hypothetical protein
MDTVYKVTSTAIGSTPVKIGDDIPDDAVRYVYSMEIVSDDDSAQHIAMYQGQTGSETSKTVGYFSTGDKRGVGNKPYIILRPTKSSGSTTNAGIYIAHETSAVHVTMTYEDVFDEE